MKRHWMITLLMFGCLIVTNFVIGCDSDDGPKMTAPAPAPTPSRYTPAEQQGLSGLDYPRMQLQSGFSTISTREILRNSGEVDLNIRFNYDPPQHYRLNVNMDMLADPAGTGTIPTRVACGVPATGRADGTCWHNDGVPTPEPHSSATGPRSYKSTDCGGGSATIPEESGSLNSDGIAIEIPGPLRATPTPQTIIFTNNLFCQSAVNVEIRFPDGMTQSNRVELGGRWTLTKSLSASDDSGTGGNTIGYRACMVPARPEEGGGCRPGFIIEQ